MRKVISLFGNMFVLFISFMILIAIGLTALLLSTPDVTQLEKCITTTMYEVRLCPDSPQYVKLKSISPYMIHALIAAEDAAFYSHKGFDWHEIQESFTTNLSKGRLSRGGSTLTQQLAKNVFLNKDKSLVRKLKEAYIANAIENRFKKDFILEKYLNVVEFGPNIYGVKAASLHYFQKSPAELHPLESAYLAFLLPNPKVYSQSHRKGELTPFARKMIAVILKRMNQFGKLSASAYQTAMNNISGFPWGGIGMGSFEGTPSYSLEAPHVAAPANMDLDEEALEELMQESESSSPAMPPASVPVADPTNEPADLEE